MPTEIPVRRPQIHMSTLRLHHVRRDGPDGRNVESVSTGTGYVKDVENETKLRK